MPCFRCSVTLGCCADLRIGAISLGIASLIFRILFFVTNKHQWMKNAFGENGGKFDKTAIVLDVWFSTIYGTIADLFLLIGTLGKVQKCIKLYLLIMFFAVVHELTFFFVMLGLGFHWISIIDSFLLALLHIWCWFTAQSLNKNWNKFESSSNKPEDFEAVPTKP